MTRGQMRTRTTLGSIHPSYQIRNRLLGTGHEEQIRIPGGAYTSKLKEVEKAVTQWTIGIIALMMTAQVCIVIYIYIMYLYFII